MFKLPIKSLRLAIIVYILASCTTLLAQYPSTPATVYIQFDDTAKNGDITSSFNADNFEKMMESLRRRGTVAPVGVRFSWTDDLSDQSLQKKLQEAGLTHSDKIENLIIGTHGETHLSRNETILTRIGGFNAEGAFGFFKTILYTVGPQLSENPHIALEACSTLCGSKQQAGERISGLRKTLAKIGIHEWTLWGATKDLNMNLTFATDKRKVKELDERIARLSFYVNGLMYGAPFYSFGIVALLEMGLNSVANMEFSPPTQMSLWAGALVTAVSFSTSKLIKRVYWSPNAGTEGRLVDVSETLINSSRLDQKEPRRLLKAQNCRTIF